MAESLQFDLVSPEQRLASVQADAVQIPGADGDMTAMAGHAPTITTLRPGLLRVTSGGNTDEYIVSGGFAEINATGITVLAEKALHRTDFTREAFEAMLAEAREAHAAAVENHPHLVDEAAKLLSDMVAVGGHIGIGAND